MRVLLDTHAFLWFVLNDAQLSATARTLIEAPATDVFVNRQFLGNRDQSASGGNGPAIALQRHSCNAVLLATTSRFCLLNQVIRASSQRCRCITKILLTDY